MSTRIEQVYAYVLVDPKDKTEGIPAFMSGQGWLPMVGSDAARMDSLRPHAEGIAKKHGVPIELVRFTNRESVEVIQP